MAFASSNKVLGFCKLFHLALVAWTLVSCQTIPKGLTQREVGSSYNLTCPGNLSKNYTFTFYLKGRKVILDDETKQKRSVLMIIKLAYQDSGKYHCIVQNETGNQTNEVDLGVLVVIKATYGLKMFPETTAEVGVHVIKEGEGFMFRCEYKRPSIPIIWWKVINGNWTSISRNKITVINDTKKTQEVYTFKKVTADDEGTYLCQVNEKKEKKFSKKHVLEVIVNKRPSFQDVKKVFYVDEEDLSLKVHLGVRGTPSPNITCFKGGKKVIFCAGEELANVSTGGTVCKNGDYELTGYTTFVIDYISFLKDHGVYTCLATNIYGLDNVTFSVDITVRPSISKESFFFQKENKVGSVKCTIREANPKPAIDWFQQDMLNIRDKPKPDSWTPSTFASKLNDLRGGRYEDILTVPWNTKNTFFRCNATNRVGSDSRIYRFIRFGEGQEPFHVRTNNPVKNEEETFTAECRITITIPSDFVFYKVDSEKVVKNSTRTKITRRHDDKFHYLNMSITNLTVNDSGTYQCTESTKLTNQKASVTLIVKEFRPAIITSLQNRTVEFPKDNSVILFCNVSGNPPPEVTWSRKGGSFETNMLTVQNCKKIVPGYYYYKDDHRRTKLVICKPGISHTGVYTCFAKNKLQNDTRNAHLNVLAPPTIDEPRTVQKVRLDIGKKITITCKANGNPFPLVQWFKIGQEKPVSNRSSSFSSLRINGMDKSYVGNYTCKAWNYLGSYNKTLLELQLPLPDLKPEESSGGMKTGTIIGIAIGIGVFVLIMVIGGVLWQRRQQKKLIFYKHQYYLKTGEFNVDPSRTLNEQCLNLTYDSDWEFPFERLVIGDRLGAGAFGEVYIAEARGILALTARDKSGTANKRRSKLRRSLRASRKSKNILSLSGAANATVALKTLKASATENEIRDLAAELKLMIHIGEHKNIVNLLGACTTGQQLYVILEFCPYGNLLLFLRSKRDIYRNTWHKEVFDLEKEFSLIDLVGAAYQVAKGMEFLAAQKLIHRDLAARNILVADEYVLKISDFGLARDIYNDDVYVKTSSGLLPVKWMAIESLFDRVYTHQSDVWSFGVLLWEMMTLGGAPYPGLPAEELLDYLHNGKRMPQPEKCPLEVYTIMRDCWLEEPEQRPTFANLVEHFGRILEKHLDKESQYLQVEATREEIEAAKGDLLKPKSDYLEPLITTNKRYDANAALPTPPTDVVTPTYSNPSYITLTQAMLGSEVATPKMRHTDPCERLREDSEEECPNPPRASSDNESGIGLEDINGKNRDEQDELKTRTHIETVV